MRDKPLTIEGDWDRFYWEFPDVYDRFAVTAPRAIRAVAKMFDLHDKIVVDVGSGTGRSTFELAKWARLVIGIEPWSPPRRFAVEKARAMGVRNVAFLEGVAQGLPLKDASVDVVIVLAGVPLPYPDGRGKGELIGDVFVRDAERAVRSGGYVISVEGAPDSRMPWVKLRSGFVNPVGQQITDLLAGRYNFDYRDAHLMQEYSSLQEAVETCGFIYGRRAIEFLIKHNKRRFRCKVRIHYKQASVPIVEQRPDSV